ALSDGKRRESRRAHQGGGDEYVKFLCHFRTFLSSFSTGRAVNEFRFRSMTGSSCKRVDR
ncbi:hypothetical protein, partial [Rhizobium sp.]|uniref:hypothetical protein n=1 Tax=Rhizobium sp. TaxID=391 RepID=UPI0039186480